MSLNKVMLIGNVGKDPEVRYLDGNNNPNSGSTKVATFTLATTERYRDRNGELRENTEWHNIVAWRNSADVAEKYIRKGTQLYIEGKLRTRSWTDQTGSQTLSLSKGRLLLVIRLLRRLRSRLLHRLIATLLVLRLLEAVAWVRSLLTGAGDRRPEQLFRNIQNEYFQT